MTQPPNTPPPPPAQPPQYRPQGQDRSRRDSKKSLLPLWTGLAGLLVGGLVGGSIVAGVDALNTDEQSTAQSDQEQQEPQPSRMADQSGPNPNAAPEPVPLGTEVETDPESGSTVTALDVKRVQDDYNDFTAIEIKNCVGEIPPEYEGSTILTDFWSIRDSEDRQYGTAGSWSSDPEISPVLDPETLVRSNECLRGWIPIEPIAIDDIEVIQYLNPSYEEDGTLKQVRWLVP